MTQSFEDWIKQSGFKASEHSRRDAFEAGTASRRAEIDLLEKEIIETQQFLNNQNCIKQPKINELQKRIDEAMKYVSESPLKDVSRRAMLNFLDILKGKKDE